MESQFLDLEVSFESLEEKEEKSSWNRNERRSSRRFQNVGSVQFRIQQNPPAPSAPTRIEACLKIEVED